MDAFSYLSVLTSIVLALGITRLLTGLGRLLQARSRVRIYWVHLLWTLNVFLFLVLNWWILFRWSTQHEWSFFLFLFVLLSPTVAFLLTVLLMPDPFEEGFDPKQHFYNNHRWFFSARRSFTDHRRHGYLAQGLVTFHCARATLCSHNPALVHIEHRCRPCPARRLSSIFCYILPGLHSGVHCD